jgi:elongation factor P
MINVNEFKTGVSIKFDNNIYNVLEFQHVKPGKGSAFVKTKLKNLRTGAIIDYTFNAGVKVQTARVDRKPMQYLYSTGNNYTFMDMDDYSQIDLDKSTISDDIKFLKENLDLHISFYEGEVLGLILADKIEFKIISTEPGIKGNTTSGALKDAVIETGWGVKVPLFISENERIIVSTKDGKYVSRA